MLTVTEIFSLSIVYDACGKSTMSAQLSSPVFEREMSGQLQVPEVLTLEMRFRTQLLGTTCAPVWS